MRLFVSVPLCGEVRKGMDSVIRDLKKNVQRGRFVTAENLHLTIAFLGETNKIQEAKEAVGTAYSAPFPLEFSGLGRFRRPEGDLYWMGIVPSPELERLYRQTVRELKGRGFSLESREFKPHLTLGRGVVPKEGFDRKSFSENLPAFQMTAGRLCLMKSLLTPSGPVYTELYAKRFIPE